MGIIDKIVDNVVEDSITFIRHLDDTMKELGFSEMDHPKVRDNNEKMLEARGDDKVLLEAQAMATKGRKGQFAPGQIIKCVESAINLSLIHI